MTRNLLGADELSRALCLRDLTDPARGPHAMQALLGAVLDALGPRWGCRLIERRGGPVVPVADNYDRLLYPAESAARDARYTRYVSEDEVLRSQTSAMVPGALRELASGPAGDGADLLLACPGLVYRRDCIDRLHVGEPHQVDLWRLRPSPGLGEGDLGTMIERAVAAALPGRRLRVTEAWHPYTKAGLQVDVETEDGWVEVGEGGLAHPGVLERAGLGGWSGLALGLGLDRLLMLRKGIDDIRLLRSADPRVAGQLLDLSPYRPVSSMPPVRRDLSIATGAEVSAEELGDGVRAALGARASSVESVEVLSETPGSALPAAAVERLGLGPGQKNVLLRLVLRDLEKTLTNDEANRLRDEVYGALHRGTRHEWASR